MKLDGTSMASMERDDAVLAPAGEAPARHFFVNVLPFIFVVNAFPATYKINANQIMNLER
jgi:hypothetical protein